jgi:peptide-methionine (R)-S-oxide reductase
MSVLASGSPDGFTRNASLAFAVARIGIGVGALAATRPAMRLLGLGTEDGTVVLARLAGIRDVALGLNVIAARDDRGALSRSLALGALSDAGDTAAFLALIRSRGVDRTVAMNAPAALYATVAGAWLVSRLRS